MTDTTTTEPLTLVAELDAMSAGWLCAGLPDADLSQRAAREIERLRAALAVANANHERFERGWYLRGDALEAIKKHCEPQPSALAAAIVATCDSGLRA